MDIGDIGVYSFDKLDNTALGKLLDNRASFVIEEIPRLHISEAAETVEKAMKERSLKSRVYTKGRAASMGAMGAVIAPPVFFFGLASAIGIAAHNVVTWSPDYEIAKNSVTGTLTITYQKKK